MTSIRGTSTPSLLRFAFGLTIGSTPSDRGVVQRVPKNVGGIRAKSGRAASARPAHYLTDRECRALDKEITAALEGIDKRHGLQPDHPPEKCPMRRPRRKGLQNMCFRNFARDAKR